jgi:hypothetical protein
MHNRNQWVQDKSEAKAVALPETKRWLDPALIQRNWEQKEAAQEAEQKRRRDAIVDGNKRMVSALNKQVAERTARDKAQKAADMSYSMTYLATVDAERERALEGRRKRLQLKLQVMYFSPQQTRWCMTIRACAWLAIFTGEKGT